LKIESNTPYDAALQVLRYGAVYMLYRLEPELEGRFKSNPVMRAKRVVLEVWPHIRTTLVEMICVGRFLALAKAIRPVNASVNVPAA
jgi:hypothetical protein